MLRAFSKKKMKKGRKIHFVRYEDLINNPKNEFLKILEYLKNIINSAIRSSKKTIMIAIYNNQNQRRYIGVKLD